MNNGEVISKQTASASAKAAKSWTNERAGKRQDHEEGRIEKKVRQVGS